MSQATIGRSRAGSTAFGILGAISFCHLVNDLAQSLVPASYPLLKSAFNLSFGEIGLLSLVLQATASLLQPFVGVYTDRRPERYSVPLSMGCTAVGLLTLGLASSFAMLLLGAALVGLGSAIFHPESSRLARLSSGGAHGLAQSLFQVGGNAGQSIGPLMAAFVILPHGQGSLAWFGLPALCGLAVLALLRRWYKSKGQVRLSKQFPVAAEDSLPPSRVRRAIAVLIALVFSKYVYLSSITSYYIFYLMHHFRLSPETSQIYLFVFLAAAAAGTLIGGPIGDRFGVKTVIWGSILGVLPFTLALPYVGLTATVLLSVVIGVVLSSAFSAIVVYAQELMPGRVAMVSGLFFGLAFGMGGIGAAALGELADWTSIEFVYRVCSFLPLIGLLAAFLPDVGAASPRLRPVVPKRG